MQPSAPASPRPLSNRRWRRSKVKGMLLTEYNEAEQMELFKEDGRREGIIETLISLVKDGVLPIKDAAKRAGITETAFEQKMTAK